MGTALMALSWVRVVWEPPPTGWGPLGGWGVRWGALFRPPMRGCTALGRPGLACRGGHAQCRGHLYGNLGGVCQGEAKWRGMAVYVVLCGVANNYSYSQAWSHPADELTVSCSKPD